MLTNFNYNKNKTIILTYQYAFGPLYFGKYLIYKLNTETECMTF